MKEWNSLNKNATVFEAEEAWEQDCFRDCLHRRQNVKKIFVVCSWILNIDRLLAVTFDTSILRWKKSLWRELLLRKIIQLNLRNHVHLLQLGSCYLEVPNKVFDDFSHKKKLIYRSEIVLVSADKLTIQVFKVLVEVRPDLQFQLCVRFHRIWLKCLKNCAKQNFPRLS